MVFCPGMFVRNLRTSYKVRLHFPSCSPDTQADDSSLPFVMLHASPAKHTPSTVIFFLSLSSEGKPTDASGVLGVYSLSCPIWNLTLHKMGEPLALAMLTVKIRTNLKRLVFRGPPSTSNSVLNVTISKFRQQSAGLTPSHFICSEGWGSPMRSKPESCAPPKAEESKASFG